MNSAFIQQVLEKTQFNPSDITAGSITITAGTTRTIRYFKLGNLYFGLRDYAGDYPFLSNYLGESGGIYSSQTYAAVAQDLKNAADIIASALGSTVQEYFLSANGEATESNGELYSDDGVSWTTFNSGVGNLPTIRLYGFLAN